METETKYKTILTPLGRAKIAAAIESGVPINLKTIAVGDGAGTEIDPETLETQLTREVWRGEIQRIESDPQNPAYIFVETTIPPDVGGWVLREFGVFDDNGALIAAGNLANSYKPISIEGSTREMLIRVILEIGTPEAVELKIDPSIILATKKYVDEHTDPAHSIPGGNAGQVLAKKTNEDGSFEWINVQDAGEVSVDAREERQELVAGQSVVNLAELSTNGLAIYIDGFRKIADVDYTTTGETQITLTDFATEGQVLLAVQNDPAGALSLLRREENLADIANLTAARENLNVYSRNQADVALSKAKTELIQFARVKNFSITKIRDINADYYGYLENNDRKAKLTIPANADLLILCGNADGQRSYVGAGKRYAIRIDMNEVRAILTVADCYFWSFQSEKDPSHSSGKHYYDSGMTMTIFKNPDGGKNDYYISAVGIGSVPTSAYYLTQSL